MSNLEMWIVSKRPIYFIGFVRRIHTWYLCDCVYVSCVMITMQWHSFRFILFSDWMPRIQSTRIMVVCSRTIATYILSFSGRIFNKIHPERWPICFYYITSPNLISTTHQLPLWSKRCSCINYHVSTWSQGLWLAHFRVIVVWPVSRPRSQSSV